VCSSDLDPEHPICIFDRDGNLVSSWGAGLISFAHAIYLDKEDNVWLVDRNKHQVFKYTNDGKLLMTIGDEGSRSDTGVAQDDYSSTTWSSVTHSGAPFNMPAGIAVNDAGEIFIADGYANARVHKFTSDGKLIMSWGDPGSGDGQFNLPHGVWIDNQGRVLVSDRENDRVQVFTQDGKFVSSWPTKLIGPALMFVDDEDVVYIPEHNGGMVSVLNLEGERLAQWGDIKYRSCHGIWVDSHKDLYVVTPGDWGKGRRVVKYSRKG
jgi:DNA-binding beta-propeller fold protein YncE